MPLLEVVVDLASHFVLDVVLGLVGVGDPEVVGGDAAPGEERWWSWRIWWKQLRSQGTWFQEISGLHLRVGENGKLVVRQTRPWSSLEVMRDEGEGDVLLFAEADGGDGLLFGIPEDPEELLHAGPFPAAVGGVFEAFFIHRVDGLGGVGEERVGRGGRGSGGGC